MMAAVAQSSDGDLMPALMDDQLVCHLLLVDDLHPLGVERRVSAALDRIRPQLAGVGVKVLAVEGGTARIRLSGGGGCGPGAAERLVEDAINELAPELERIDFERAPAPQPVSLVPRALSRRRLRLEEFALDDLTWAALEVPVALAFFVTGGSGAVTAAYPSPLGVIRSSPDTSAWAEVCRANPVLDGIERDVEALLVYRRPPGHQYWLLPLDDCYRLASVVRTHWKGFIGGPTVWSEIDGFFDDLQGESRSARQRRTPETAVRRDKEMQWAPS